MRTLHNKRKVALSLVSLFHLIILYDDLTFWSKLLYHFQDFFLLRSAYIQQDKDGVKF